MDPYPKLEAGFEKKTSFKPNDKEFFLYAIWSCGSYERWGWNMRPFDKIRVSRYSDMKTKTTVPSKEARPHGWPYSMGWSQALTVLPAKTSSSSTSINIEEGGFSNTTTQVEE